MGKLLLSHAAVTEGAELAEGCVLMVLLELVLHFLH